MVTRREKPIQDAIVAALRTFPHILVYDTSRVGMHRDWHGNPVNLGGTKGQSDLLVIMGASGRKAHGFGIAHALEVKEPRHRPRKNGGLSDHQVNWRDKVWAPRFGLETHHVVYSVDHAMAELGLLEQWKAKEHLYR